MRRLWVLFLGACLGCGAGETAPQIGSKLFTEQILLGEIFTQLCQRQGAPAVHRRQFGRSHEIFAAILRGEIDAYPDYTGTLRAEILADRQIKDDLTLRDTLRGMG